MTKETSRRIVSNGPAVGKITGFQHVVLYTRDMNASIRFYRDLLGLKIVRSQRFSPEAMGQQSADLIAKGSLGGGADADRSVAQIFFELGNGELFSLYESSEVEEKPDASIVPFLWPPSNVKTPRHPQKLDHLAFNVETRKHLEWFQAHLRANGVAVSDIVDRQGSHRFLLSIYFSDPSNNPLEIATLDRSDPGWNGYDFTTWFRDPTPPPAFFETGPLSRS